MKNKSNKSAKIGRIISYFFIPILIPLRVIIKVCRETKNEFLDLFYPLRLGRAKKKASKRWRKSGGELYGIRIGRKIRVYDKSEMKELNKHAIGFLRKNNIMSNKIDYKLLTVFTLRNGRILEK
ncbi:MAG: hypothetical protein LBL13_10765 [Bacteroidales bacterium]|jgi:hypothetical protein|nr:hypothetical protein [Bacteroidales bacterium]